MRNGDGVLDRSRGARLSRRVELFKTVLEAHADEEERDIIPAPPPVQISDEELEELGNKMAGAIEQYRGSALHELRTKGRGALVRAL
jgi:hypothetical protein